MDIVAFEALAVRITAAQAVSDALKAAARDGVDYPSCVEFWVGFTLRGLEDTYAEELPKFAGVYPLTNTR
jgi:hypothetical protein